MEGLQPPNPSPPPAPLLLTPVYSTCTNSKQVELQGREGSGGGIINNKIPWDNNIHVAYFTGDLNANGISFIPVYILCSERL